MALVASAAAALRQLFLVGLIVGVRDGDQLLPIGRIRLPPATAPFADLLCVRLLVGDRIRDPFLSKLFILGVSFAQLFEMRTHVSRIRKFGRRAARTRARAKALQARERKAKNPMTQRKHRLRCIYGISLEEYDTMLARQGGACASRKKKPDTGKSLCVDHCHVTGMVRGLLCHKCNSVLAFGNDDLDILRAAIAYLQAALASEASGQRGNFNSARA